MKTWTAVPCESDLFFLGESCRWDERRGELYWVNVDAGTFYRARVDGPRLSVVRRYDLGGYLTAVAPMSERREGWLVARDESIYALSEEGEIHLLASPEARHAGEVRTNDGAADPWGRYWIGSMAYDAASGRASLYSYHESTGLRTELEGVTISNGLGWSPDARTLYYVDSGPGTIYLFDLDERGAKSGQRVFAQFDVPAEGTPDGLCVDAEGALWVAVWGGAEVRRYAPSGELIGRVGLATSQPSCCALGGPQGTTLYVTTAQEDMTPEQLAREPEAGRLFYAEVGVPGVALNAYRPQLLECLE